MFSLKKAELESFAQSNEVNDASSSIHQEVSNQRVAHHLLKGEVTQEVIDLRYRDYTIADNARNFKYIGNGKTIKINNSLNGGQFRVNNREVCLSILDSISFDKKFEDQHTVQIKYSGFPKFHLEKRCVVLDVNVDKLELVFHFSKYADVYKQDKPFINELKRMNEKNVDLNRHEFSKLESVYFTTFNIKGIKDYLTYCFNTLQLVQISENDHEYLLRYNFKDYEIIDITSSFYSESMALKYANNEPKQRSSYIEDDEAKYSICEVCGKPIKEIMDENIATIFTNKNVCHTCLYEIMIQNGEK